jgi:hypothetical protein
MKSFLFPFASLILLVSCKKNSTEDEPLDPNKSYTIRYEVSDQVARTRVKGDTLRIDFNQRVNFLVEPSEYRRRWALHMTHNFSSSFLNNQRFSALANASGYANDWLPINLNDVHPSQISSEEVIVDGRKMVRVTLSRLIEFYSVQGSGEAAIQKQNALVQSSNETVAYSAFYSYGNVFSIPNNATVKITYTR